MRYFDYETAAREAGISSEKLARLVGLFSVDEPDDPMMVELHLLRVCMAIKEGKVSLDQVLAEAPKLAA